MKNHAAAEHNQGEQVCITKRCIQLFTTFFKIGALTFGGGMSMLPILQQLLVEKKHWLTEEEILDYFAIGQCTPGIIAVNVATFCGYKRAGLRGALTATLGIVCPSWIIILVIARFIAHFSEIAWVARAMKGVYVAVAALLIRAVLTFSKKIITDCATALIAVGAFLAIQLGNISGIYVILSAGIAGYGVQLWRNKELRRT